MLESLLQARVGCITDSNTSTFDEIYTACKTAFWDFFSVPYTKWEIIERRHFEVFCVYGKWITFALAQHSLPAVIVHHSEQPVLRFFVFRIYIWNPLLCWLAACLPVNSIMGTTYLCHKCLNHYKASKYRWIMYFQSVFICSFILFKILNRNPCSESFIFIGNMTVQNLEMSCSHSIGIKKFSMALTNGHIYSVT